MYPTEEETTLWVNLNLAQRSIYRAMDTALKSKGLPALRWYDVLWAIEMAGDCGSRAFELEQNLLFEQSNLSRLLRKLINEELVEETVFEGDRRGKVLRITKHGRKTRKEMWKVYGPLIHKFMSRTSGAKDLETLAQKLSKLHDEQI